MERDSLRPILAFGDSRRREDFRRQRRVARLPLDCQLPEIEPSAAGSPGQQLLSGSPIVAFTNPVEPLVWDAAGAGNNIGKRWGGLCLTGTVGAGRRFDPGARSGAAG